MNDAERADLIRYIDDIVKEAHVRQDLIFVLAKLGIQCPAFWGEDALGEEE